MAYNIQTPIFDIVLQLCMLVLYTHPEGSVSQICFILAQVWP